MNINPRFCLASLVLTACCMAQTPPPAPGGAAPLKRIEDSSFGTMANGTVVKVYTLTNAKGMQARVLTLGAIIAGIKVPDKEGKFSNVVACADSLDPAFRMQAQTIGRVANRIAGAKFSLDGKEYATEPGTGGNTLHSGNANFGVKVWEVAAMKSEAHESSVQLSYTSPDGDGGFPGTLAAKVTFTLTDDNEFRIDYQATTDKTTIVNFTNHAYWNLNGAAGWGNANASPFANHELWIDADKHLVMGAGLIPTGELTAVSGTPADFTKPAVIGSRVAQLTTPRYYDHAYVLNNAGKMALVARLRDPVSGREMEVRTDQPGLQVYTGQPTGVALETQHHPDSIHHENFPTTVLKAGETFKTTTMFTFSAK